jgi:hypothetical protein
LDINVFVGLGGFEALEEHRKNKILIPMIIVGTPKRINIGTFSSGSAVRANSASEISSWHNQKAPTP